MPEQPMTVTVCYARADGQVWLTPVTLPGGSTLAKAIEASGVYQACDISQADIAGVGVFGIRKPPDHVLKPGDRVELYRALTFDPMESRRRRAAHRNSGILKRKHLKKSKAAWQQYLETSLDDKTGSQ